MELPAIFIRNFNCQQFGGISFQNLPLSNGNKCDIPDANGEENTAIARIVHTISILIIAAKKW